MQKPLTLHHEPSQENNHLNQALPNLYLKDTPTSPQIVSHPPSPILPINSHVTYTQAPPQRKTKLNPGLLFCKNQSSQPLDELLRSVGLPTWQSYSWESSVEEEGKRSGKSQQHLLPNMAKDKCLSLNPHLDLASWPYPTVPGQMANPIAVTAPQ
ncbi:hypothetical protein Tco_1345733 [Tanacetum coccineum]